MRKSLLSKVAITGFVLVSVSAYAVYTEARLDENSTVITDDSYIQLITPPVVVGIAPASDPYVCVSSLLGAAGGGTLQGGATVEVGNGATFEVFPGGTYVDGTADWTDAGTSAILKNPSDVDMNQLLTQGTGDQTYTDQFTDRFIALREETSSGSNEYIYGWAKLARIGIDVSVVQSDLLALAYAEVTNVKWNSSPTDGIIVPEPTSLSILALSTLGLIRRRR